MNTTADIIPRWLKLEDAAKYSSIGLNRLIKLASGANPKISGFKDPDDSRHPWIFDRVSLDAYRESQAGINNLTRQKVQKFVHNHRR